MSRWAENGLWKVKRPAEFSEEQWVLWQKYADSIEEARKDGSAVFGFQSVCLLEGVQPPPDVAIRAALGEMDETAS